MTKLTTFSQLSDLIKKIMPETLTQKNPLNKNMNNKYVVKKRIESTSFTMAIQCIELVTKIIQLRNVKRGMNEKKVNVFIHCKQVHSYSFVG